MARALPVVTDYEFDEEADGFGEPEETPPPPPLSLAEKGALALVGLGVLSILVQILEFEVAEATWLKGAWRWLGFLTSYPLAGLGAALYFWLSKKNTHPGIKHDGVFFGSMTGRGALAWIAGVGLTSFYIVLYWYADTLAGAIRLVDPLSLYFTGEAATQWFLYGFLYTVLVLAFGVRTMMKYRHNRYQLVRTSSVMFFQLGFAFLLPQILKRFYEFETQPYLTFFWPLKYDALFPSTIARLGEDGALGQFMIFWGLMATFVATPILTYFFGKRWYCSWVCGCGGLAETLGDGYRQLSDKSVASWTFERGLVYTVLGMITVTTGLLWAYTQEWIPADNLIDLRVVVIGSALVGGAALAAAFRLTQGSWREAGTSTRGLIYLAVTFFASLAIFGIYLSYRVAQGELEASVTVGYAVGGLAKVYGFAIGAAFSGVIGVGFYPLLGSRVWCRFGCPMAAVLGILQRFYSRFRITTNGGQCISCGNCSTYCEMGIDVRAYAQRGENIVRASCVGCGVCAAVCPRGVLKLENGPLGDRFENQRPEMGTGSARPLPTAK
ncbi:MAG: 4Fe-4S binding protein [Planctomycetes bacterium]|nr:4Fe-4S binding protein [Planctomycetota bacterium]